LAAAFVAHKVRADGTLKKRSMIERQRAESARAMMKVIEKLRHSRQSRSFSA